MKINLLAGGPLEDLPELSEFQSDDAIWIGVDRGVFTLLTFGIEPTAAFGDFDSVTREEWEKVAQRVENLHKYLPEKDETDMELALNWAVKQKPKEINIFGGTGGRLDHFLGNIQLLVNYISDEDCCKISLIDKKNTLMLKKPGTYSLFKIPSKRYISFLPFTPSVEKLSLEGFKYSLSERNVIAGSTLCISNELISDNGTYSFSNGILIVIRSQD